LETVAPAFAFALATPIQVQGAATRRIVLVPLEVPTECQRVYLTLLVDAGQPSGRSFMAASDTCPRTSRRLFIRDKTSGIRFLVDTGADMCVFPRQLVPGRLKKSDYVLSAANGTPIATYGTRTMTLNLGLWQDFFWRFLVADVSKPAAVPQRPSRQTRALAGPPDFRGRP
jgi:hypothetical protein